MTRVLTFGHGTAAREELTQLLTGAGVRLVVDVRRFPGSRRNPHVARDVLARWLPEAGIGYRWAQDLGGRRSLPQAEAPAGRSPTRRGATGAGTDEKTSPPVPDSWWKVAAFRAYAAHTRTPEFAGALDKLLADVATTDGLVAVMCSESVWWRCHRRIIADVLVLTRDVEVQHLMPGGRLSSHEPSAGARVRDDGLIVWDVMDVDGSAPRPPQP